MDGSTDPNDEMEIEENPPIDPDSYIELSDYKTIPGVKVEIPISQFGWESYHSSENQAAGADTPAPALCDFLNLKKKDSSQDLCDQYGKPASLYRNFNRDSSDYFRSSLIYLRKDLLKKYLKHTGQKLVWVIWGERDFKTGSNIRENEEVSKLWNDHKNIHIKVKIARL